MWDPTSVVPTSIMPAYKHMFSKNADIETAYAEALTVKKVFNVPYDVEGQTKLGSWEEAQASVKAEAEEALKQQQAMLQQYGMNPFGTDMPEGIPQQMNIPKPAMSPQQLMALQQMLYSGAAANPMDQDFMAMTSGMNRLNFQC